MQNKVVIVTGDTGSGKTQFLKLLVQELLHKGFRVKGFVAEGFPGKSLRERYELSDLNSDERMVFCRTEPADGWEKAGLFYIDPAAVAFGERLLHPDILKPEDVVVIDEIGPFELHQKGWLKAIRTIGKVLPGQRMIWVVRKQLLEEAVRHFDLSRPTIIEREQLHIDDAVDRIENFWNAVG